MSKPLKLLFILLLCILCVTGGFFFGRTTAPAIGTTFYATITHLKDDDMLVEGLDVNSINFRGEFSCPIEKHTRLTWNYTDVSMGDFQVGDRVAITFTGGIRETYPAGLENVLSVDLLEQVQAPSPDNATPALYVSRIGQDSRLSLSTKDAQQLLELLENAQWLNDATKCEPDCLLEYEDQTIDYHSSCGTFNVRNHSLCLSDPQKAEVNALLSAYIVLGD